MTIQDLRQQVHISNRELAEHWGIPAPAVSKVKESYSLNDIYPLTMEMIDDATDYPDFHENARKISDDFMIGYMERKQEAEALEQANKEIFISVEQIMKHFGISRNDFIIAKSARIIPMQRQPRQRPVFRHMREAVEKLDVDDVRRQINELKHKVKLREENASLEIPKDVEKLKREIHDGVRVNVRDRNEVPLSTTFYFGPTNSGKTYHALENLCAEYELDSEGIYVYAGPLRMLAFEVYKKLVARYGKEAVGFITGEESINPEARLIAVTTEMAPMEGASIVLDEAHWIADESRGDHWTQLLVGGKYQCFHIASAEEAAPTLEELMADSYQVFKNVYKRRTEISYEGAISLEDIPSKTAVVCFSKKTVYAAAKELSDRGHKVGVLYGALPLVTRQQQIDLFIAGEYDIIVTTDVIGHGINLPIDNVVFVQTEKFDGRQRRNLHRWETAQIAGRAGRFGLSEHGKVYVARGLPWMNADEKIVSEGVLCAAGKLKADLDIREAMIAPRLMDLGLADNETIWLSFALKAWQEKAVQALAGKSIRPSSLHSVTENLEFLANHLKHFLNPWENKGDTLLVNGVEVKDLRQRTYRWGIPLPDLWSLVTGPFDPRTGVVQVLADWMKEEDRQRSASIKAFFNEIKNAGSSSNIDMLESSVKKISELKMAAVIFGENDRLGYLKASLLAPEEAKIVARLGSLLQENIENSSHGRCSKCGKSVAPHFSYCNQCSQSDKPKAQQAHGATKHKSSKNRPAWNKNGNHRKSNK